MATKIYDEAACDVIERLRDFGGFDGWWDSISEEDRENIKQEVAEVIRDRINY